MKKCHCNRRLLYFLFLAFALIKWCFIQHLSTEWMEWMSHRKQRETKQQPSMLPGPAVSGYCLVSLCFLCDIHPIHSVQHVQIIICILQHSPLWFAPASHRSTSRKSTKTIAATMSLHLCSTFSTLGQHIGDDDREPFIFIFFSFRGECFTNHMGYRVFFQPGNCKIMSQGKSNHITRE